MVVYSVGLEMLEYNALTRPATCGQTQEFAQVVALVSMESGML